MKKAFLYSVYDLATCENVYYNRDYDKCVEYLSQLIHHPHQFTILRSQNGITFINENGDIKAKW